MASEQENIVNEEKKAEDLPIEEVEAEEVEETIENESSSVNPLEAELKELKDKHLRLYSEFENFRKRTNKEKIDLISTANESLLQAIIPVVDDFDRALKANETSEDINAIKDGLLLIYNKFINTLQNKGLKEMETIGQPFDTELHEAITQIPAPSEDMKGKVVDQVEKGYYLGEKVIRFAKVVIGS